MKTILKWAGILAVLGIGVLLAVFLFFQSKQELSNLSEARSSDIKQLIDLPTGTCHYELSGDDEDPLVVLVHGGSVTGMNVWNQNVDYLTNQGYRVLRYDLLGRGLSDFRAPLSLNLYQEQLDQLLSALQIKEPFHIAGLSMGGMVVAEFVSQHPDRVKSMTLFAPAAMGLYKAHWTLKTPLVNDFMVRVYWMPRALGKQMSEFFRPDDHQDYAELIKKGMTLDGFKASTLSLWLDVMSHNRIDELKEIGRNKTVPTAVFFGKQDHLVPPTMSGRYQEAIPEINVHLIDDAGHMPHYENPSQVHPIWMDFISKSEAEKRQNQEINIVKR